jgi:hypothetical protein
MNAIWLFALVNFIFSVSELVQLSIKLFENH